MSPEERDIISRFVQRVAGQAAPGSVPATAAAPLPPVDHEADQHLQTLYQQYPEARYRMTQFAFGQEQALQGAAQHIQALDQQLAAARQAAPQAQYPQNQGLPQGGGFFSRLFGGPPQGQPQAPYAQPYGQAAYGQPGVGYAQQQPGFGGPPGYGQGNGQPMAQRGGSGFLGSALTTAAGVAGGMLAFNAIEGLFTDRGAQQTGAGTFGTDQTGGGFDQSGWANVPPDQGVADNSGWAGGADNSGWQSLPDQSAGDNTGWQNDPGTDDSSSGGGWDDSGDNGGNSDWS